jgi:tRNA (Thr-GGU) A37 N-methylase
MKAGRSTGISLTGNLGRYELDVGEANPGSLYIGPIEAIDGTPMIDI